MADIADISSQYEQTILENQINSRTRFEGQSLSECEDCGESIPEQRQKLGGIRRCVECQGYRERRR